ncbi:MULTISPECIES: TetR/AcrR family transcriptional regulator [Furfurilactobacillus]|uniref:TetR family transcriptional regulator n=1 Tax=Furfurilactobacillus rossiae TaxID=231049 RepID=A0A7C9MQC7_9LACO|nr:TetR/AcrR family transcriptional regulator [Furfurilactobacillus milii]MYV05483.1 TetR family transcriptional regulator [Furfurilactobacillus milii]
MIDQTELTIKLNRVILIEGFQKLSMSKLAQAVDVSRATLYLYFKNKDEIVQAVVGRHLRFISERPIPAEFDASSFITVWLNSLLLMGSTTETFTTDLQRAYPELAHELRMADHDYFTHLISYVAKAQQADVVLPIYTPDFVVFQADTLITSVLQQVKAHRITLEQAEQYLSDGISLELQALLSSTVRKQLDISNFEPMKTLIFKEFRATYALIA